MLTVLFMICFLGIFGKLAWLAVRATWGLTKILVGLVFLPVVLLIMVVGGVLSIAFPILLIVGAVVLIRALCGRTTQS